MRAHMIWEMIFTPSHVLEALGKMFKSSNTFTFSSVGGQVMKTKQKKKSKMKGHHD